MEKDVIRKSIKDYVFNTLLSSANTESIEDNTDLVQSGLMNSLKLIQLSMYLAEKFNIALEDKDFEVENYSSIESIVCFILQKVTSAQEK